MLDHWKPMPIKEGSALYENALRALESAHTFRPWFNPADCRPVLFYFAGWYEVEDSMGLRTLVSLDGIHVTPIAEG